MTEEQKQRYYASQRWYVKRAEVIKRCNGVCERCFGAKVARVCHKTFARMGVEELEDLEGLCMGCFELNYPKNDRAREDLSFAGIESVKLGDDSQTKPKIYCAGKISKDSGSFLRGSGPEPVDCGHYVYVGPFYISCDHGCFHGNESHGQGSMRSKDYSRPRMELTDDEFMEMLARDDEDNDQPFDQLAPCGGWVKRKAVVRLCQTQIDSCDILYASICGEEVEGKDGGLKEFATCYGTLYEIGYAKAHGKYVHISFGSKRIAREMWFLAMASDSWDYSPNAGIENAMKEYDDYMKYLNDKRRNS